MTVFSDLNLVQIFHLIYILSPPLFIWPPIIPIKGSPKNDATLLIGLLTGHWLYVDKSLTPEPVWFSLSLNIIINLTFQFGEQLKLKPEWVLVKLLCQNVSEQSRPSTIIEKVTVVKVSPFREAMICIRKTVKNGDIVPVGWPPLPLKILGWYKNPF